MKKVLVANRGEIALRIMRTLKKLGITTVAVYSEADRNAPFVRFADEAYLLGPAPSTQSYLRGDKIIEIALAGEVEGIHPGYGFLSENAEFARAVSRSGLIFIGPSPESIEIMGSKLAAKEAVKAYNIPMVPGVDKAISDPEEAKKIALSIGFPILIKASAGGGGKGMRIVEKEEDLTAQMDRAISEALSAFGDGSVFIEKYIKNPRHIEIQVLADQHGNYVHLFERECSIQRRHQKVVEEAPSVILDDVLRTRMGEDAVNVARSCGYFSAGTVEFLMDKDKNYYFLEMNTRLQVEHPVTEWITGIDIVDYQIRIARGELLGFSQADLSITGHALELRVYAEDPRTGFLPSVGKIERYQRPRGPMVRLDDGYEEGMQIPVYYDPMISKLITYGADRREAIQNMVQALEEYQIEGVATTLDFGKFVCQHPVFIKGDIDTHFIEKYYQGETLDEYIAPHHEEAAILGALLWQKHLQKLKVPNTQDSNGWHASS